MYFDSEEKKNISIKSRTPTWEADGRDPGPANVSTGLKVQQENLRELRKFLFDELLQRTGRGSYPEGEIAGERDKSEKESKGGP